MRESERDNFDEFAWERELREEDARLHAYLNELPKFIDLPGEDDLLVKRLARHPELVRDSRSWQEQEGDFLPDDDFSFPPDWQNREGASLYLGLQQAAAHWCRIFASRLGMEKRGEGLRCLAQYGLLIGWTVDLVYMEEDEMPTLKVALLKRISFGFNDLCGILACIQDNHAELMAPCRSQLIQIQGLRRKALNLLSRYREKGTA